MKRVIVAIGIVVGCDSTSAEPGTSKQAPAEHGGVDAGTARKLADAADALQRIGTHERSAFAGAALGELEAGRLPRQLTEAMAALQSVPPEQHTIVAMKALTDPVLLGPLDAICDGKATKVLGEVAQLASESKITHVWDGCGLGRVGLIEREQAERAELGPLLLGCVAHHILAGKGGPSPDELALLRAFASG
jgi:hypothetical protein